MVAMKFGGAGVFVAVDRTGVEGGELRAGFRGPRLASYAAAPLSAGALEPRPFDANILDPGAVADAVKRVAAALGAAKGGVVLVLPDGVARASLLHPPANVAPDHFARFRLAQGLPYPAAEAVVGTLKVAGGGHLAGAVWRRVVAEYEQALAAADLDVVSVELAPFLALAGFGGGRGRDGYTTDVILGAAAFSLAASDAAGLRVFRTRRRTADPEIERIADEVERTAAASGDTVTLVRVVGRGSSLVIAELARRGLRAEAGWSVGHEGLPVEPFELVWAGATA